MTQAAPGRPTQAGSAQEAERLAARFALQRVDQGPGLGRYLAQLWARRAFVWELARAKAYTRNSNNYLGQLWAALNPLLLAGSYFLVFGVLLQIDRGVDNFIAFLTIGIFIFSFVAASATGGAKAITGNQNLVRGIRFPRAALPVAVSLSEIIALLPALAVLMVLLPLTGELPSVDWFLLIPAVVLLFTFCTGVGMLAARIVAASRDALNLIPTAVRLLRYVSGVFFSIEAYAGRGAIGSLLQYQPVAVYLDLFRGIFLDERAQDPVLWSLAAGWALLLLLVGTVLFWRAEERYGRD